MSKRFSEKFLQALSNYVTHLLANFEMSEWEVRIIDDPPESEDAGATIKTVYGRKSATVRLAKDFFEYPREEQQHYIIHELCHLISEGIDSVIQNGPETLLGKPAYTILYENYHIQMEYMTDHIAGVLRFYATGGEIHDKLLDELMESEKDFPPPQSPKA